MKAFVPFSYPDGMAEIIRYLSERGRVCVDTATLEELYEEFSDTRCAQWLCTTEKTLEEFAEWLAEKDI